MSADQQCLAALAMKTGEEMRYFELVKIICGVEGKRCYICLGKHAVYFLRQDLSGKIHAGGELMYAYITKVIQDLNSKRHLLLVLGENKPSQWTSERLFIQSENRALLLKNFQVNWQTDHMWRIGKVIVLPMFKHPITREPNEEPPVHAFVGFKWKAFQGYRFMVPYEFKEQANSIQEEQTGEYANADGTTLVIQVHEVLTMDQLMLLKRERIRWVAAEYKAQLVKDESHFYVLRNQPISKKMNLTGDISAWYAWDLIIRTKDATLIVALLRRQYTPPTCNSAQDIAVIMRVPSAFCLTAEDFHKMMATTHLVANTVCPDNATVPVYRDIVQAKLDALRYDDEGMEWIGSHMKLKPAWTREAKIFVRSLYKMFVDDNVGCQRAILELPAREVLVNAEPDEEWAELEYLTDVASFIQDMKTNGEGLPASDTRSKGEDDSKVLNCWFFRVARYFAWAVDGGILGSKFTLDIMIDGLSGLTEANMKACVSALNFMLHLRPRLMTKPWNEVSLMTMIKDPKFSEFTFNERVMHAFLSTEFIRKQLGRQNDTEYFKCLGFLLGHDSGLNLKAYICRQFMEMRGGEAVVAQAEEANVVAIPALMNVIGSSELFLATYACAALVNLSNGNEDVKMLLMSKGIATLSAQMIKTKDDDLILYTLMLNVNLTKVPFFRAIFADDANILPLLYDILTSTYHQCKQHKPGEKSQNISAYSEAKEKILTQVCILIGQFCNDKSYQHQFIEMYPHTLKCLMYLVEEAAQGSPLASKAIFCCKQVAAHRGDIKSQLGANVCSLIVEDMATLLPNKELDKFSDFFYQGVLLLQMLSANTNLCTVMDNAGMLDVLQSENIRILYRKHKELNDKASMLADSIERETRQDFMG